MKRPTWVSQSLFPFASHYFDTYAGSMHFIDEGTGHPILLVHGTPTWSFLYRGQINDLSQDYRVIAVDHLGFGLSAKPQESAYKPQDHAGRLEGFIDYLGLDDFTLVVHDFGGPIGLSYALENQESVSQLVLFNTWLWSLTNDLRIRLANFIMRGTIGKVFYRNWNGSPRFLLRAAWGDKTTLIEEVHQHYMNPFPSVNDRTGPWVLAQELLGSTDWYESLWQQRSLITQKPTLLIWGLNDPFFGESYLNRWDDTLANTIVHRLPNVGHFVPEEAATQVTNLLQKFLDEA